MLKSTTGRADLIFFMVGEESAASNPAKHEGQGIWNCSRTKHFKNTFKSTTLQNMAKDKCFLSKYHFQFIFCLTLTWSQQADFNQLITSQTTINMLKCKYCIQTRSWKTWLRGEQDFQKQLEFSSTQINFPNPLKAILFLILQALHSLCIHSLPHTGPTQSSTSAGLQKSFCRRYRKPDWSSKEHCYYSTTAFHNGSTARQSHSTPREQLHYGISKH